MTVERLSLGKWGENEAAKYLRKKRFKIVQRNFTCRLGEIDIIARKKDHLVFVEVKTKSSSAPPAPRYSVNLRKQRQIIRVARYYLKGRGEQNPRCRFDVIEIIAGEGKRPEKIVHLVGAFRIRE
ncbi:MAG: YraN family protein [Candidatus Auribacterota bacterium]|nr:YraN family protein [Candidatus Auribacterota bacterium]